MRWMAELGLSGLDTLPLEIAAESSRMSLKGIVGLLDHLDDTDNFAAIFGTCRIEPRLGFKRAI